MTKEGPQAKVWGGTSEEDEEGEPGAALKARLHPTRKAHLHAAQEEHPRAQLKDNESKAEPKKKEGRTHRRPHHHAHTAPQPGNKGCRDREGHRQR